MNKNTLILLFLLTSLITTGQVKNSGYYTAVSSGLSYVTDDADNGDGATDGAFKVDGLVAVAGQGAIFTFDGSMKNGKTYNVETVLYNTGASVNTVDIFLYNKTDGTTLGTSERSILFNTNNSDPVANPSIRTISFSYVALSSDEGDVLELRMTKSEQLETSRNFNIDYIKLESSTVNNNTFNGVWKIEGDTAITVVTSDADNGDGAADGALFVDGQSAVVGQGVIYTFSKVISSEGLIINVSSALYNPGASFVGVLATLYNVTDGANLATLGDLDMLGGVVDDFSNNYTTVASDVGDVLEIRLLRDDNGATSRDFAMDRLTIDGDNKSTDVNVWNGTTSDWSAATNWNNSIVPTIGSAIIPSGTSNDPVISGTTGAQASNLTVDSGATLTINSGGSLIASESVSGSVTYELAIPVGDLWHLVSSPVANETYDDTFVTNNNIRSNGTNRSIASFDNTTDADGDWNYYQGAAAAQTFNLGQGYSISRIGAGNISFTGTPSFNNVINTITIGAAGTNAWNLVGNSYTAYINIANYIANNSSSMAGAFQAVYVWNPTNYAYEPLTTGQLYPGQAFFVNSALTSTSVAASSSLLSAQTGVTFYKSTEPFINIFLEKSSKTVTTKINFNNSSTNSLDSGFDIASFSGAGFKPNIYTALVENDSGMPFAIQSLSVNDLESIIIPIGVNAAAGEEIIFSIETQNLPSEVNTYLEDRLTNTFTRLDESNAKYTITLTDALNGTGRFYMHTTTSALSVEDVNLDNISIYKFNASTLRIAGLSQGNSKVTLHNILGKQVMSESFTSVDVKDIALPNLAKGIYIVKLENNNSILSKKIILE